MKIDTHHRRPRLEGTGLLKDAKSEPDIAGALVKEKDRPILSATETRAIGGWGLAAFAAKSRGDSAGVKEGAVEDVHEEAVVLKKDKSPVGTLQVEINRVSI